MKLRLIIMTICSCVTFGLTYKADAQQVEPNNNSKIVKIRQEKLSDSVQADTPEEKVELITDKAEAFKQAVNNENFQTAQSIAAGILAQSKIENWSFYPFNVFIGNVSDTLNDLYGKHLDSWITQDNKNAVAYLIRAKNTFDIAWAVRGNKWANQVPQERWQVSKKDIKEAFTDVQKSISLSDKIPYSYYLLLRIIKAEGNDSQFESAFQDAIAKYPDYYPLYQARLESLTPKRGGSVEAMQNFVDKYAGSTSAKLNLKFLYLELFANDVEEASYACGHSKDNNLDECMNLTSSVLPKLIKSVKEVLNFHGSWDTYEFTTELSSILHRLISIRGEEAYSGSILQLAAESLNSSTQLVGEDFSYNNYMIDEVTAEVWARQGNYDNAEKLLLRALADIDNFKFPNKETKVLVKADIYEDLAGDYQKMGLYQKTIDYEEMARLLNNALNKNFAAMECFSYLKLREYKMGINVCSDIINHGGNLESRFWRAKLFEALNKSDEAMKDYEIVANQPALQFFSNSVTAISLIYFNRNDIKGALNVLNSYPSVFDENSQSNESLAVNYNNRCYAYMHLGDLQKALNDCKKSLQFGIIPDALSKYKELVDKLKSDQ